MSDNSPNGIPGPPPESLDQSAVDYPVDVALGRVHVPYYGDRPLPGTRPAPPRVDSDRELMLALVTVVGDGKPTILGMDVIDADADINTDAGAADAVQHLLDRASEQVTIDTVYVGKGFRSIDVLSVVADEDYRYVNRPKRGPRVKRYIDQLEHDVGVMEDFAIESIRGAEINYPSLVLARLPSAPTEARFAFITNHDVTDETAADRRRTCNLIETHDYHAELAVMDTRFRQSGIGHLLTAVWEWTVECRMNE